MPVKKIRSALAKKYNKLSFILPVFGISSFLSIIIIVFLITGNLTYNQKNGEVKYSIFTSKPLVLGVSSYSVDLSDGRAQAIDEIYENYNCPISGYGKKFVEEADKNNIPYWLVAAISFQESSCGKHTPYIDGKPTYNLWGYGVWGDNVYGFDSVEHGIETVSEYLSDRFYSRGITEPCEIMRTYTPPSKGSWCEGVKFFGDRIVEYKTPQ